MPGSPGGTGDAAAGSGSAARVLTLLGRGARGRCPHCGPGAMFRTWLALEPSRAACGPSFERDEREDYRATRPDVRWSLLTWGGVAQIIVRPST